MPAPNENTPVGTTLRCTDSSGGVPLTVGAYYILDTHISHHALVLADNNLLGRYNYSRFDVVSVPGIETLPSRPGTMPTQGTPSGTLVRCTDSSGAAEATLTLGRLYTTQRHSDGASYVAVVNDRGRVQSFYTRRFVIASEEEVAEMERIKALHPTPETEPMTLVRYLGETTDSLTQGGTYVMVRARVSGYSGRVHAFLRDRHGDERGVYSDKVEIIAEPNKPIPTTNERSTSTMFYVVSIPASGQDEKRFGPYADPQDAATKSKEFAAIYGEKFRVQKAASPEQVAAGRAREQDRLSDGTYRRLPEWFPTMPDHFAHLPSSERHRDEGWLAYSPTEQHLADDKMPKMLLPGSRYLSKFFGSRYSSHQIAQLQERLIASINPVELHITHDREMVRNIYSRYKHAGEGSSSYSCMSYPPATFGLPDDHHPAEAYILDDPDSDPNRALAFAYTTRRKRDGSGQIEHPARAIVWPAKKTYVRVYGLAESDKSEIRRLLAEQGYTKDDYGFVGARVALRPHPNPGYVTRSPVDQKRLIVAPYLDGCSMVTTDGIITRDGDGEVAMGGTGGHAYMPESEDTMPVCEHCYTVRIRRNRETYVAGQLWCGSCVSQDAYQCQGSGDFFPDTEPRVTVRVHAWASSAQQVIWDEVTWALATATRIGAYCDNTQRWYGRGVEMRNVTTQGANGEVVQRWSRDACAGSMFYCHASRRWYDARYYVSEPYTNPNTGRQVRRCAGLREQVTA